MNTRLFWGGGTVNTMTMAEVLIIQEQHLKQWDSVLLPYLAAILRAWATKDNATTTNPYDICRGEQLYGFVANTLMKKD